jgi:histone deacetylase 1/2
MDVDNTFLNTELTEEIFLEQPEGFKDNKHPNYVC